MNSLRRTTGVLLLLLPLMTFGLCDAQAQSLKIGYADPEAIIAAMPEYRQIQQQLQNEVEATRQALQSLAADFQAKVEKYQKQQPLLSAERRAEREQELAQEQNELQQSAAQKEQEITQREQQLMSPLLQRVQDVIDAYSKEQSFDVVIRSPALLYVNPDKVTDMNLEIARRLGLNIEEEASSGTTN